MGSILYGAGWMMNKQTCFHCYKKSYLYSLIYAPCFFLHTVLMQLVIQQARKAEPCQCCSWCNHPAAVQYKGEQVTNQVQSSKPSFSTCQCTALPFIIPVVVAADKNKLQLEKQISLWSVCCDVLRAGREESPCVPEFTICNNKITHMLAWGCGLVHQSCIAQPWPLEYLQD